MVVTAPWTYFALVAIALALVSLPAFRFVDAAVPAQGRFAGLDGLRGLAAFSVFAFHAVVTHRFVATGVWEPPASGFYALPGPLGVSVFFMITGFLFWTRLLSSRGGGWRALYVGRLLRIAPMYLFAVLAMLVIVFARTGFELREPSSEVFQAVLQWLALGLVDLQPDVNGYPATHVLAGVTWTISYEWMFYASLVVTALAARSRAHLPLVAAALALSLAGKFLWQSAALGFAALFLCGMTVASLLHAGKRLPLGNAAASTLALGCLALIVAATLLVPGVGGYGTPVTILLACFFYLVCSGATLFGLLTARGARRLGHVSYSLYLLQGIVLTLVFAVPWLRDFGMATPGGFWLVAVLCAVALVGTASVSWFFIELPGIRLGRRLAGRAQKVRRAAPCSGVRGASSPARLRDARS